MAYGIRKGLEDIARELKGIKNILSSMWNVQYQNDGAKAINPELFADEYLSTEECARRLNVSDQTIRNWISMGRSNPEKGWKEGIQYVNIMVDPTKKAVIRIPWNALIQSFANNRKVGLTDMYGKPSMYQLHREALRE
jgi:hypothetical protein